MIRPIIKDPSAIRTYGIYWGDNINPGDALASVTWTVPAGMTKVSESVNSIPVSEDGMTYAIGTVALLRVSGGTVGVTYPCVCHIVTAAGDQDQRTLQIVVKER